MIEFEDVSLTLGDFSLHQVSLAIHDGDYYVIMGPSGAGKTIILETIAGLHVPESGRVLLDGKDMRSIPPENRNIGLVYQDYSLFPHMKVEKNIAFGMRMRKIPQADIERQVRSLMKRFGIAHLAQRSPLTLSGGEQQRVAIARALAIEPGVLLLDEPLSALDPMTRELFVEELRTIHREQALTIVQVTHSTSEASELGTRMAMIMDGRLVQEDRVEHILRSPGTNRIARFIGYENIFDGVVRSCEDGLSRVETDGVSVWAVSSAPVGQRVAFCIGADEISLYNEVMDGSALNVFPGAVTKITISGALALITIDIGIMISAVLTRRSATEMGIEAGAKVFISFKASAVHVMDEDESPGLTHHDPMAAT
ncbi:MAG TPA: ATP-binding cassette domain-containing protein [Methanoregulaceae archaeon]|jgi:molybdate/tungstate transport system ATP-binding protein|nr:ATP-binding cassette domain-containing protein [Methanolinea sp.]MCC7566771.1 ATP-binding cassette domain-containing protein [Methanoregulaceae archaeon]MDD3090540.1 ATP-binding cassette domain-containing protein [Methanoregulaceae archaeon]MDD5048136.1 ATP-binding cassette domain-containing protein [Methanoregulaceae archaeon]MDD5685035.1 ATP-binding cassette domain-containing protein [Methanoregulaceae archaeon]